MPEVARQVGAQSSSRASPRTGPARACLEPGARIAGLPVPADQPDRAVVVAFGVDVEHQGQRDLVPRVIDATGAGTLRSGFASGTTTATTRIARPPARSCGGNTSGTTSPSEARATGRTCGSAGWFAATHPLALESRLGAAAQWYSDDMHFNDAWHHIGSGGSTLDVRVDRTGYPCLALGESIAKGFTSPESVMSAWLASAGHCANIMRPHFSELGFGRTEGELDASFRASPRRHPRARQEVPLTR